jgi:hypothetical protein
MSKNNKNEYVVNYEACWVSFKNYIETLEMMAPESQTKLSVVMSKIEEKNQIAIPVQ